ncbi:MAG: dihydropteroate synthase [Deltaproteobacteria bacterium]|nr:dihydropteroate synthase [Deltaproteobacteria bacterium]
MLVIGEKINATRTSVAAAVAVRDAGFISSLALAQAEAGADVIDVNAGTGQGDPERAAEDMLWLIRTVEKAVKLPLAIDTEIPSVMGVALSSVTRPPAWINSVSAETSRLERVLPLAKKFGSPIIALLMGDDGIPRDAAGRMRAAEKIYGKAVDAGIDPARLYFDPLVMPVGAETGAGDVVLSCLSMIKRDMPAANTVLGLSNVSFGLPLRSLLNRAFLVLCAGAGLSAVILDPSDDTLMMEMFAAEALLGRDPYCGRYIKAYRKRNGKGGKS